MSVAIVFSEHQLSKFIVQLGGRRRGRIQNRIGVKTDVRSYGIAWVDATGLGISGYVSGPNGRHAEFSVSRGAKGPVITITREQPSGTYSLQDAVNDVETHVTAMIAKAGQPGGKRDTSLLKGYYLESTGARKVGATGKKNLGAATSLGLISAPFAKRCVSTGFTMKKF